MDTEVKINRLVAENMEFLRQFDSWEAIYEYYEQKRHEETALEKDK